MSVLDRAIVKAFQRRRDFEAVQQTAAVERCAVLPDPVMSVAPEIVRTVEASLTASYLSAPSDGSTIEPSVADEPAVVVPEAAAHSPVLPPLPEWIAAPVPPPLPEVETRLRPASPAAADPEPEVLESNSAIPAAPTYAPSRFEAELQTPVVQVQQEPGSTARATYTASFVRTPEPVTQPEKRVEAKPVATVGYTATEPRPVAAVPGPPVIERPVPQKWKWPEICEQLDQFTGEGFRQLAKHLQFAADEGHKTLAFVSSAAGAGRTSVLLTLTRILALEGRSDVLLIDADRRHPQLASLIPETPTVGLREVLHGQLRLDQVVIPMDPGRVSVLPLPATLTDSEWQPLVAPLRALLKQARRDYDMILIDAGVLGPDTRMSDCWLRGAADAVITISRQLTGQRTEHAVLDWKQIGIESLGVIETFA